MTEDDAKMKPCISGTAHNVGRPDEQSDGTVIYRCIGSACVAWRWDKDALTARMREGVGEEYLVHPSKVRGSYGTFVKMEPAQGYCGLAGKP